LTVWHPADHSLGTREAESDLRAHMANTAEGEPPIGAPRSILLTATRHWPT